MAMEGPVALPTLPKARVREILASLDERQKVFETVVDAIALQKQWKQKQQEQQALLVEQQAAQQSAMADALASEAEQARESSAEHEAQGLSVRRRVLFPWGSDRSNDQRQEVVSRSSLWDKEWAGLGMPSLNGIHQVTRWKLQSRGALMPTAEIRNELSGPLLDLLVSCSATSRERTLAYCRLIHLAGSNPDPELSPGALDRNPEQDSICALPCLTTLREALNKLGYRSGGEADTPLEPGLREPPVTPGPGGALAPENDTPSSLQLHTLKMLLSVVTAIMKLHQKTGLENLVEGENDFYDCLADWVKTTIMLSIDPEGYRLSRQLRDLLWAAMVSFTEHGWSARADSIVLAVTERLDPSMGLDLLRGLLMPVPPKDNIASSDAFHQQGQMFDQLRNGIGAIMLSKVIPAFPSDHGDGPELLEELLCSTDAITSQSWFTKPQQLVDGAVSGDGMLLGPDSYGMATLECLLGLADAVLWPDALNGTLTAQFLSQWLRFLIRVQRSIKHMVPEDQAVKVLATHYELEYRQLATSQGKTLDEHA